MRNALAVAKKDFFSYVNSWIGVFVLALFFVIAGLFFFFLVVSYARISMEASQDLYRNVRGLGLTQFVFSSFFLNMGAILIFFMPLLSMRSFAEERKYQTLELLFTYPLSDFEIIWGKYLAMLWFLGLMIIPTGLYLGLIVWLGGTLDWGPVLVGYLGFLLLANAYLALGLFVSAISENQVVSALITFGALTVFWIMDWMGGVTDGTMSHFFTAASPLRHYREFTLGILDLSHTAYFCFFYFYFLFLALRAVETRNWKG
jgi:ABC-2 type transport system permease protein